MTRATNSLNRLTCGPTGGRVLKEKQRSSRRRRGGSSLARALVHEQAATQQFDGTPALRRSGCQQQIKNIIDVVARRAGADLPVTFAAERPFMAWSHLGLGGQHQGDST